MNILTLFVVIPVLMLLGFWLAYNIRQVHTVMVTGSTALLAPSVRLTIVFIQMRQVGNTGAMLSVYSAPWFKPLNITYTVGMDGISVAMLLLSSVIVFTGTSAFWQLKPMIKGYFLWFTLLSTSMLGFFIFIDLFTMFMFYGVALIPMYLLIGVQGSGSKECAAMKLTLMPTGESALLIIGILGIYFYSGTTMMDVLEIAALHNIPVDVQKIFFPSIFIGFGMLDALFPSHIWLPDGHASVPIAVSMLHAGMLTKLGGYGRFRIAMPLLPEVAQELARILPILTTVSVVYGALSAYVQADLRCIDAYSSVSHYGLVLFVLLMMTKTTCTNTILQMLSHGLVTALFFAFIGMIYGCMHMRDVRQLGGLMKAMSFLDVGYVVAGLADLGSSSFSGLVAGMTIFVGSFANNGTLHRTVIIIACISIVVTITYILRVVGKILYQKVASPHFEQPTGATWGKCVTMMCLILCVAGSGIASLWVSNIINNAVGPTLLSIIH